MNLDIFGEQLLRIANSAKYKSCAEVKEQIHNVLDAILALPEMVEMMKKVEKYDEISELLEWNKKHGIDLSKVMSWKKKAKKYSNLPCQTEPMGNCVVCPDNFGHMMRVSFGTWLGLLSNKKAIETIKEWREKAEEHDEISELLEWNKEHGVDLSKVMSWKEKSEKWDKLPDPEDLDDLIDKVHQLDLLMFGLMVREKCTCGKGKILHPASGGWGYHPLCHGTGYVEREATVEEVREMIEGMFRWGTDEILLKSGATLFMKEKE